MKDGEPPKRIPCPEAGDLLMKSHDCVAWWVDRPLLSRVCVWGFPVFLPQAVPRLNHAGFFRVGLRGIVLLEDIISFAGATCCQTQL